MLILLLKVTLLLTLPLACLPLMRRASSAMRHLVCALALGGALILPLSLLIHPRGIAIALPILFRVSALGTARGGGTFHLSTFLLLVWGLGAGLLLARLALGYWRVSRLIRESLPADGEFHTAAVSVPMVSGLLRPTILLPHSAQSWPAEQRAAALRHERAHVARGDLWTNLMAHVSCAVYWFHPLVWLVAGQMRQEQETACDDAVLRSGFEPVIYAEALVATAHQLTRSFNPTSLIGCHMLTQTTLKSRIARLLDSSLPRMSSTAALRRTAVLLVAILAGIALLNAADEQVYKVGDGVSPPRVVYKTDPQYTDEARDAKIDGPVTLTVVVGTDGIPHDINIVKGLDAGLDVKAVEAVQKWRFEPGTKDGAPVAVKATIQINFKLL